MDFPGGAIKFGSFNSSCDVNGVKCSDISNVKGYILPTSYFGNVFNITAIELVAVKSGQLAIDVSTQISKYYFNSFLYFVFIYTLRLFTLNSQKNRNVRANNITSFFDRF